MLSQEHHVLISHCKATQKKYKTDSFDQFFIIINCLITHTMVWSPRLSPVWIVSCSPNSQLMHVSYTNNDCSSISQLLNYVSIFCRRCLPHKCGATTSIVWRLETFSANHNQYSYPSSNYIIMFMLQPPKTKKLPCRRYISLSEIFFKASVILLLN